MKEKLLKLKFKADKVTDYFWEVDFGFIITYIGIIVIICTIIELIGGSCISFVLTTVGVLLGKAIGYRLRVRKEQKDKEE